MESFVQLSVPGNREHQWYALVTRYRHEKKAHSLLTHKGYESYLPLCDQIRYWSDRKKKIKIPLFSCYLFVYIDLRERIRILQTEGVLRFVCFENEPVPIPENQIGWLKCLVNGQRTVQATAGILKGQTVRVIYGPFRGMEGIYIKSKSPSRLHIYLDCIHQSVSVEINADGIVPLNRKILRNSNIPINGD